MFARIKLATWCRVFHNWKPAYLGGYSRYTCSTCKDQDFPLPL